MKCKPILFSTLMVEAILEGRKTQTRRVVKLKAGVELRDTDVWSANRIWDSTKEGNPNPLFTYVIQEDQWGNEIRVKSKYQKGDILWVRETWKPSDFTMNGFTYKAEMDTEQTLSGWKPSIHMPKEAARIFLKVTAIRCERLFDLTDNDAINEGVEPTTVWQNRLVTERGLFKNYLNDGRGPQSPRFSFFTLWELINGRENLGLNPIVWVYEFEMVEKPKDF